MFARLSLSALTLAAAVALPGAASAQDAFARSSTWLRAGPGTQYPNVVRVSRGEPIDIYGCLRGRSWCDVSASGDRGWMRGSAIDYVYQGRRVIITDPFAAGVAVLSFGLADYWNDHYRNRSWYRQDRYWRGPDWDRRPGRIGGPGPNRPPHVGPGPDRPPHVGPGPNRPPHVGPGPNRPPHVTPGPNRPPHVGPRPERPQMERPRPERPQMQRPRPERPQMQRPERPQMQQRPERPQMQQQRPERPQMQPRPQGGNSGGRGPACPPGGNCR